ncbi:hypothetical protein ACFX13_045251 [Malus domestica]
MKKESEESIQRLRAEQEENLRLAKVQMAEQLKFMLAHVGNNIGSFGVGALQSTLTQQQGYGSSHGQISLFEGGNDKNVQCGPPVSSAMMHEDCQSENTENPGYVQHRITCIFWFNIWMGCIVRLDESVLAKNMSYVIY